MARKRLTRDRLEKLMPVPCTFVATLTDDGPLHLIVERGVQTYGARMETRYDVTACKRVARFPYRQKSIQGHKLCSRCGDKEDFEIAVDNMKAFIAQMDRDRRLKKQRQDSEFEIDMQWTNLGKQIEQMIMDDAESLIESETVIVPFNHYEISLMLAVIVALINRVKAVENPSEHEERVEHIARRMLAHVEDYSDPLKMRDLIKNYE